MKIIKIPITEQNREVYWSRNKDKKAWEKLMSECPSMTSKEFWNNEWEEFDKEEISTHWYSERSERWRKGEEERERIKLERLRKEEEARYKDFDEKLEEWKSGEINFLNTPFYIPGEKPNAWIRIKGNIIETSKQIKIGIAEARKLWRAVSAMHRGAEFRHGLVEDVTGHQWSLNRYENDLLTAGCHRIAYNEMERIAKQLGWV